MIAYFTGYLSHLQLCCCQSSSRPPSSIQVDTQTLLDLELFHHSMQHTQAFIYLVLHWLMIITHNYVMQVSSSTSYHICVGLCSRFPLATRKTCFILKDFICELGVASICFCQQTFESSSTAHRWVRQELCGTTKQTRAAKASGT